MFGPPLLLLLLLSVSSALAWQPDHILRISNGTLAADCTPRMSTLINGTSPGPVIRVREGDHIWIRVYNDMVDGNTTLHWHGVSQYMSPFADGTPQTSQWPIAPQNYFDYEFKLDKGSAGTYMYHTHVGFQIVTAYGAFIVEDARESPYAYDDDLVLILGDFYHAPDAAITAGLLGAPFAWLGDPQALAVNGNAYGACDARAGEGATCVPGCHTEVVHVLPDKTYRVRVIGATALSFIYMAIEDHPGFNLIEVDSGYVAAHNASHLEINSGQRYSFLLRTKPAAALRALNRTAFWANMETRWRATRDRGAWLLQYDAVALELALPPADAQQLPAALDAAGGAAHAPIPPDLNETVPLPDEAPFWVVPALRPLDPAEAPPADAQVARRITIAMQQLSDGTGAGQRIFWNVDRYMYSEDEPAVPYLVQAYEDPEGLRPDYEGAAANGGFDTGTNAVPIRMNETVDMVFLNLASFAGTLEAHPWHIHGQHPYVMAQGLGNFSDEAYAAARQNMTGRPIQRDTNNIFAGPVGADYTNATIAPGQVGGWMVYRMRAEVAGAFLLHCHLQPHAVMGMATMLLVGIDALPALPTNFTQEFATYNATPRAKPHSFFELYPDRRAGSGQV